MSDRHWQKTSAWAGLAPSEPFGETGVRLDPLDDAEMATLIVRSGQEAALKRLLPDRFGCDVPAPGQACFGATCALVWSAPGQWLAVALAGQSLPALPALLAGIASVTDQSSSRALVRVSGSRARDALAKGFAIDLHPSAFATGSVAVTKVVHLSVQIWQIDDAPTFMIAVPRSFAGGFWSWLTAACAPFGLNPGAAANVCLV